VVHTKLYSHHTCSIDDRRFIASIVCGIRRFISNLSIFPICLLNSVDEMSWMGISCQRSVALVMTNPKLNITTAFATRIYHYPILVTHDDKNFLYWTGVTLVKAVKFLNLKRVHASWFGRNFWTVCVWVDRAVKIVEFSVSTHLLFLCFRYRIRRRLIIF